MSRGGRSGGLVRPEAVDRNPEMIRPFLTMAGFMEA